MPSEPLPPSLFTKRFDVPPEAIDRQGHASNLAYVAWMQDVAIHHSAAVGWPMDRYLALGAGWVVRSHFIEYLRPVFAGERLAVHTWVPRFDQRATPRRYLFEREHDRRLVAEAETRWVFVDLTSGRRRTLPAELLGAFDPLPDDRVVRAMLGLA
jgi:acyl-CoA thioester hydrolase